ncbi:MAG: class I SAM-dependent methyltransferase [Clostridia bacterium]|nr:class I SAM-dependent methyltransferase [Clostridia bacterium]
MKDHTLEHTRAFFDSMAESWDASTEYDPAKTAAMLKIAGVPENARILDVACGTGVLFPELLAFKPAYLRAIDLSPEMVRAAKAKFPEIHVTAEDFYTFPESGFDVITLYNAYPHFLDKDTFAKAALRILKPGGRLIIFHGAGRNVINGCHKGESVSKISMGLYPVEEEAAKLAPYFAIDTMVDREHLYLLSGKVR